MKKVTGYDITLKNNNLQISQKNHQAYPSVSVASREVKKTIL